jgi:hypothetical protein
VHLRVKQHRVYAVSHARFDDVTVHLRIARREPVERGADQSARWRVERRRGVSVLVVNAQALLCDCTNSAGWRQLSRRFQSFYADAVANIEIVVAVRALSQSRSGENNRQQADKGELFHANSPVTGIRGIASL